MESDLLSRTDAARLTTLCVSRLRLHEDRREFTWELPGWMEYLIYPLIGACEVQPRDTNPLHVISGRGSVQENPPQGVLYGTTAFPETLTISLLPGRGRYTADMLLVCNKRAEITQSSAVVLAENAIKQHHVGKGTTHERLVYEIAPPLSMTLHAGETLNRAGGWSSWPPHATQKVAKTKYAGHQEVFFVITPGVGIMALDGYYANGEEAKGVRIIENGELLVTPLGSHPIVFTPGAWGYYFWVYTSTALTKTYNQFAHHVREYVQ